MIKKAAALLAALAITLSLAGCSYTLSGEYSSVTRHVEEEDSPITVSEDYMDVRDYSALKDAVTSLVASHRDTGRIRFSSYDGNVEADLSEACREVYRNTAIGAFAVDYMSHTITRIVSYYEAEINITYRRSAEQINSILEVSGLSELDELFESTLHSFNGYLVLQTNRPDMDAEYVADWFTGFFVENPLVTIAIPKITVDSYPDSGIQRILEINIAYEYPPEEITLMKKELLDAAASLIASIQYRDTPPAQVYSALCSGVSALAQEPSEADQGNIYSLLVNHSGGSLGYAQTFKFICIACGLDCITVSGTRNGEEYYWNIIEIDGQYYHVDCMECAEKGLAAGFLKTDADMVKYSWDADAYPACEGELSYSDAIGSVISGESPAGTP